MELEVELEGGYFTATTIDNAYSITIDVYTGEVDELLFAEADIRTLNLFVTRARARYNKLLRSEAINDFLR